MRKVKGMKQIYILFVVMVLIASIGLHLYNNAMSKELADSSCQTIGELIAQQRLTFTSRIESEVTAIETIAELMSNLGDISVANKEVADFLEKAAHKGLYEYIIFADKTGQGISGNDVLVDISAEDYFKEALSGKTFVSDPHISPKGESIVYISTPILVGDEIAAVLAGAYITSELQHMFYSSFNGLGYAYICDSNGDVITRASLQTNGVKTNVLEYLRQAKTLKHDDYETIAAKMKQSESGHAVYQIGESKRLLHYSPIGINGWYIFSTVPDEEVSRQGNYLLMLTTILTACIAVFFCALMAYVLVSQFKYSSLLYKKVYYNDLTGCPNLNKFREEGAKLLQSSSGKPYSAMRLSIDGLDFLNEIFGYSTGDTIIKAVAESLNEIKISQDECVAHIYGDRFIALLQCATFGELEERMAKFNEIFNKKIEGIVTYKVKFAIGLYIVEPNETDIYTVIEKVSFAQKTAKKNERLEDKVQKYDSKLKEALKLERDVEAKMERALADREFTMFLQPKYRLDTDKLEGAEALARWWINGKYIMYPADFIPIFEKNGFVVYLDMYIFEEACKFIRKLIDENKDLITISTNFSRLHLLKDGFVSRIAKIADKYGVPHKYLEVEITESSMVGNEAVLKSVLAELHEAGFTLSMDDFGSGYSSLGLMKEIPIDVVKIDRSFFEASQEVERERIVISSVIDMAKKLNIHTVAEGVETQEHIDFLKTLGCEIVQGYFYAKPMPFSEFFDKYLAE